MFSHRHYSLVQSYLEECVSLVLVMLFFAGLVFAECVQVSLMESKGISDTSLCCKMSKHLLLLVGNCCVAYTIFGPDLY